MKSDFSRQRVSRSEISVGSSLVLLLRSSSWVRQDLMAAMHSVMGTEGKRASASKEYILDPLGRVAFFIFSTNWVEFLQIRG